MPQSNSGFTLLEVLVALTILAISATIISSGLNQSLRQSQSLEDKTFASWVADNKMTEIHARRLWPEIGQSSDAVVMAGRNWRLDVNVKPTIEPNIREVDLSVSIPDTSHTGSTTTLTGYLGKY